MDVINNRYKVIREIYHGEKHTLSYVVIDFQNDNKVVGLSIINSDNLLPISQDFIRTHFLQISKMPNERFFENYEFNSTMIEEDNNLKRVFFFTYELHEEYSSLSNYIDPLDIEKILKVIVCICQAQNLAIINGFLHSIDNIQDFFVYEDGDDFKLKVTDLVTLALNQEIIGKEYSFENIASLFLSFLDGYVESKNVYENIQDIREVYKNHFLNEYQNRLFEVILSLCKNIRESKYGTIIYDFYYTLIADINAQLNTYFSADVDNIYSYLCKLPNIESRQKRITEIVNEITTTHEPDSSQTNVFLITGNVGLGKSYFLTNLIFNLNFEDVDYYHVELLDTSYVFFLRLFSTIFSRYSVLATEVDINNLYLQIKECCLEANFHDEDRYDLIKEMTSILYRVSKIRNQVIIIDNFNSIDKFTFEFIFTAVTQNTRKLPIYFVLSFSKNFKNLPPYFKICYDSLLSLDCCLELNLKSLTPFETAGLIKNILQMRTEPVITSKEISKVTGGNPRFIVELIFQLVEENQLWKNKTDGYWEMMSEVYSVSNFFEVPDSILKFVKSAFGKYFKPENKVYRYLSIFHVAFKKEFIGKLLPKLTFEEVEVLIDEYLQNNFVIEIKPNEYLITEKVLQVAMYSTLSKEEKENLHSQVIEILKNETDEVFVDEIFIHYAWRGDKDEVLRIAIQTARRQVETMQFREAIVNYERAILILDGDYNKTKIEITSELAGTYCKLGVLSSANILFDDALPAIKTLEDQKVKFRCYINYCELLYEIADLKKFNEACDILVRLFNTVDDLDELDLVQAKKVFIFKMILNGDFESAASSLNDLISFGASNSATKSELPVLYRMAGLVNIYLGDYEMAQGFFDKSYALAKESNDTLNMLRALNHIANILITHKTNFPEAERIYNEVLDISVQHGFEQISLLCCVNISSLYLQIANFKLAEYYLSKAMEKLLIVSATSGDVLFYVMNLNYELLIKKNNFLKARTVQSSIEALIDEHSDNILINANIMNFYNYNALLDLVFGDCDSCLSILNNYKLKVFGKNKKEIIQFEIELIEFLFARAQEEVDIVSRFSYVSQRLNTIEMEELVSFSIFICTLSIPLQKFDMLKRFSGVLLEKIDSKFDNLGFIQSQVKILNAMLSKEDTEQLWNVALVDIRRQGILSFQIIIQVQLAIHYFDIGKYGFGILTFIGAQNDIIKFMKTIPTLKQLDFFNLFAFKVPFQVVYNFIKMGETKIDPSVFSEKVSDVGLKKLLNSKDINALIKNSDFLEILLCEVFDVNDWVLKYRTLKETIENFGVNYEYNIKITLNLMMQRLLAVYSNIIITYENNKTKFMFASDCKLISFMEFSTAMENGGIEGLRQFANKRNLEIILVPISDELTKNTDKLYTLLFVIQKQVAMVSKRRVGYCKSLTPFIYSLLDAYHLNNSINRDDVSNAVTPKYFEEFLSSTIGYDIKTKIKISICYFSIENLKMIERFYGYAVADTVIKNILEIVFSTIQSIDLVARYAKDEFAILFYGADKQIVLHKIDLLRDKIGKFDFAGVHLPVALCFGVAFLYEENTHISDIINKAHFALLHSKSQGINKVVVYNSSFETTYAMQQANAQTYLKAFGYSVEQVPYLLDFISMLSGYASKKSMLEAFLHRLLDIMRAETVSIIQFTNQESNDVTKYLSSSERITVKAENITDDVAINMYYLQQAVDNTQVLLFDETKLHENNAIVYPTWQSVLISPIYSIHKVKAALYLTANSELVKFTNKDSAFIHLLSMLLEKEL